MQADAAVLAIQQVSESLAQMAESVRHWSHLMNATVAPAVLKLSDLFDVAAAMDAPRKTKKALRKDELGLRLGPRERQRVIRYEARVERVLDAKLAKVRQAEIGAH